jgi:hypothetical protein
MTAINLPALQVTAILLSCWHSPMVSMPPQALLSALHWPWMVQACPGGHLPHKLPQPSLPQTLPTQLGRQLLLPPVVHWPAPLQALPALQEPQVPPQPSGPHCFPEHLGAH